MNVVSNVVVSNEWVSVVMELMSASQPLLQLERIKLPALCGNNTPLCYA